MLARDEAGTIVGRGDVGAQTRRVLASLRQTLTAAGSSLEDVVSATVYLTSPSDFQPMNAAYRESWASDPPTRTTVIAELVVPEALVEISMIAVPRGAERVVVLPEGWMKSPNPYSYGIRTGDTLFLSGLVPRRGRDNWSVTGEIKAQTHAVMENAGELLKAAGMSFANVVSSRVYLTDTAGFAGMNEAYGEYFKDKPPARATVKAGLAGPDFNLEITFIASSAPREVIGTPPIGLPLSPAIKAGRRLYLSGMLGNTPATAGNMSAQTSETLARIHRTLASAGAGPAEVVDSLVYITDAAAFQVMNESYRTFFDTAFPARTTVATPLVAADGLVEIMMTAVVQ